MSQASSLGMREQVRLGTDARGRMIIYVQVGAGGGTFRSRLGCERLVQAGIALRLE